MPNRHKLNCFLQSITWWSFMDFSSLLPDGIKYLKTRLVREKQNKFINFIVNGNVFIFLIALSILFLIAIEFNIDSAAEIIYSKINYEHQVKVDNIYKVSDSTKLVKYLCAYFIGDERSYEIFIASKDVSNFTGKLLLTFLMSGCFIAFVYKLLSQSSRTNLCIYIFSLTMLLCASFFTHKMHSKVNEIIGLDSIYLSTNRQEKKIKNISHLDNIIIEPNISTMKDLKRLMGIISAYDNVNIFIDHTTLSIQNEETRQKFIEYLKNNKDKINLYTDIEFTYGNIGMLSQMAASSLQSHESLYNECYRFGSLLKQNYEVDFIFGPVLDRRTSSSESTIGNRSFGQDFGIINENAFICALAFQHIGIKSIPKHFPGHPHVFGRDINPHFGVYTTQYSDKSLSNNAIPFSYLSNNENLNIDTFMTDHISIPSINGELPYSIYFDIKGKKFGVKLAELSFLSPSNKHTFITDDLTMLVRGSDDNKMGIDDKTRIIESNLNSYVYHCCPAKG